MPKILLLATGGTIASTAQKPGGPVTANVAGGALLAGISLPHEIEVIVKSLASVGSGALSLDDILGFAKVIEAELPLYDGVVMTHGTDTMEETAFVLELLLAPQKPVVLTGAQRHAGEADTDGPRNLRDAILAAASPDLGAAGVVILFEGDIHAARYVRKTHTSRVDTFRSGDFGKLGAVDQGQLRLRYMPKRLPALGTDVTPEPVALIAAGLGLGPDMIDFAAQGPYKAAVLQGFGRGNFPNGWADAAARMIAAGKPVIVSSRCPEGEVAAIYGNDSGGVSMQRIGAYVLGDLDPAKARLLLCFVLGQKRMRLEDALAVYNS